MNALEIVRSIGIAGLIDIALMAVLIYATLSWTRMSRASSALTGIVLLGVLYLAARQFGLVLTATVFERFFAIILIALIVIFQGELRTVFERVAALGLRSIGRGGSATPGADDLSALLARTAFDLARHRVGALIVIPGQQSLAAHVSGGIELDGRISETLIKSLFDHHSPGHDGAVLIDRRRISRFAAHLPLSTNAAARGAGGTRHAAALGITEHTDALSLVVSEERGVVSLAREGRLVVQDNEAGLFETLEAFAREQAPRPKRRDRLAGLTRNWKAKLAATGTAIVLWIVLVYGARPAYRTVTVPIEVTTTAGPEAQPVAQPVELRVTLRGPLRAFWVTRESAIRARFEIDAGEASQQIVVTPDALDLPTDFAVEQIEPRSVVVTQVVATPPATEPGRP